MRDDFPRTVAETLAKRVGNRCSNPKCRKRTSGPHTEASRALNVGVAAHITAASPGGPRYDHSLSPDERKGIGNGLWLCQVCAKLVDNDEARYQKETLIQWKQDAEQEALREIEASTACAGPSDLDALKEYRAWFDRAALQDALRSCGSYKRFAGSLGDLISLLNTGSARGQPVTKRRSDFASKEWRDALEGLYHELRSLRQLYTSLVKSGAIDEDQCTCNFHRYSLCAIVDAKKQAIIDRLNATLRDADLPPIRGVS